PSSAGYATHRRTILPPQPAAWQNGPSDANSRGGRRWQGEGSGGPRLCECGKTPQQLGRLLKFMLLAANPVTSIAGHQVIAAQTGLERAAGRQGLTGDHRSW